MQKKSTRPPIYDTFRAVCKAKGTSISNVLIDCNRSSGSTGAWKNGTYPNLDIVMDMAELLNVSLDQLCYGLNSTRSVILTENQREWLEIIDNIPNNKQEMCKDFLRTHVVVPDKYVKEKRTS